MFVSPGLHSRILCVLTVKGNIPCSICLAVLHSPCDPTEASTLIKIKNYMGDEDVTQMVKQGLAFPSGSLCRLLVKCEQLLWHQRHSLSDKNVWDGLLYGCLSTIELDSLFPALTKEHDFMTSDGISGHKLVLIHLVILKYVSRRVSNIVKDSLSAKFFTGNAKHHACIFANV